MITSLTKTLYWIGKVISGFFDPAYFTPDIYLNLHRAGYLQSAYGCLLQANSYNLPEFYLEKAKWLKEKVRITRI